MRAFSGTVLFHVAAYSKIAVHLAENEEHKKARDRSEGIRGDPASNAVGRKCVIWQTVQHANALGRIEYIPHTTAQYPMLHMSTPSSAPQVSTQPLRYARHITQHISQLPLTPPSLSTQRTPITTAGGSPTVSAPSPDAGVEAETVAPVDTPTEGPPPQTEAWVSPPAIENPTPAPAPAPMEESPGTPAPDVGGGEESTNDCGEVVESLEQVGCNSSANMLLLSSERNACAAGCGTTSLLLLLRDIMRSAQAPYTGLSWPFVFRRVG